MNKIFKEKLESGILYEDLEILYEKICKWHANIGFLHNYCKAYANLEGVYYFVPFTQDLKESILDIAEDLEEIINKKGKIKTKNKYIDNINRNFKCSLITLDD